MRIRPSRMAIGMTRHREGGSSLEDFLEDSPTVSREAAVAVDVPLIEGEGLEQILAHLVR